MKKIASLTLACMAVRAELTIGHSQQIGAAKAIKPARRLKDILNGNVKDLVKPKKKQVGRRLSSDKEKKKDCGCKKTVCECNGFPKSGSDPTQKYGSMLMGFNGKEKLNLIDLTELLFADNGLLYGKSKVTAAHGGTQDDTDVYKDVVGAIENGHYFCNRAAFTIKPDCVQTNKDGVNFQFAEDQVKANTWKCSGWLNPASNKITATCNNGNNQYARIFEGTMFKTA